MQMVLVLVTGSALANARPIKRGMKAVAATAKTPDTAIIIVTVVMILGSWFNWGFGLIISALLAKEVAKVVRGIHYPLLVASAYSGFIVWHAGFSGSIPLKIAGVDSIMTQFADGAIVPASTTIFSWQNLVLVVVFLITLPLINKLMMPKDKAEILEVDPALLEDDEEPVNTEGMTPARRLEEAWILSYIIGAIGLVYIIKYFLDGGSISLNIVNFIFLVLGLFLHKTPIRYVRAVNDAIKTCGGIVLQFPFTRESWA